MHACICAVMQTQGTVSPQCQTLHSARPTWVKGSELGGEKSLPLPPAVPLVWSGMARWAENTSSSKLEARPMDDSVITLDMLSEAALRLRDVTRRKLLSSTTPACGEPGRFDTLRACSR